MDRSNGEEPVKRLSNGKQDGSSRINESLLFFFSFFLSFLGDQVSKPKDRTGKANKYKKEKEEMQGTEL